MKNRCFTKHPLKTACLGFQVCVCIYIYIEIYIYIYREPKKIGVFLSPQKPSKASTVSGSDSASVA